MTAEAWATWLSAAALVLTVAGTVFTGVAIAAEARAKRLQLGPVKAARTVWRHGRRVVGPKAPPPPMHRGSAQIELPTFTGQAHGQYRDPPTGDPLEDRLRRLEQRPRHTPPAPRSRPTHHRGAPRRPGPAGGEQPRRDRPPAARDPRGRARHRRAGTHARGVGAPAHRRRRRAPGRRAAIELTCDAGTTCP